ncbi:hypothetical protein OG735_01510 [Streptomyces sp. NBC_01210]|uniref:hypothetical protein n=1 Tax=Streptomyces sp. NBC_01210 TaxID=2903774 RepID=UPI002E117730|nr:hypothetical protein OG735_01510 [Streptomyces sp. NBC_01210]
MDGSGGAPHRLCLGSVTALQPLREPLLVALLQPGYAGATVLGAQGVDVGLAGGEPVLEPVLGDRGVRVGALVFSLEPRCQGLAGLQK